MQFRNYRFGKKSAWTVVISSHVLSDLAELLYLGQYELPGYLAFRKRTVKVNFYKRLSRQQFFMSVLGNKLQRQYLGLKTFLGWEN